MGHGRGKEADKATVTATKSQPPQIPDDRHGARHCLQRGAMRNRNYAKYGSCVKKYCMFILISCATLLLAPMKKPRACLALRNYRVTIA